MSDRPCTSTEYGHICHYCGDGGILPPICYSCGKPFKCSECGDQKNNPACRGAFSEPAQGLTQRHEITKQEAR